MVYNPVSHAYLMLCVSEREILSSTHSRCVCVRVRVL